MALSFVLVSGAGLFVRSLRTAQAVDLGVELDGGVLMSVNLRNHGYTREEGNQFIRQIVPRLERHPGVE